MEPALVDSPPPSIVVAPSGDVPGLSATNRSAVTAAAVILVVIVLSLVTAISVILARFIKWRRKHEEETYELAQGKQYLL